MNFHIPTYYNEITKSKMPKKVQIKRQGKDMAREAIKIQSMRRSFSIVPESINLEERTVEIVWTTGARATQFNYEFGGYFTEELEVSANAINMERLSSGAAPYLNMHDAWSLCSILGVIAKAWVDEVKTEGRAIVRFGKDDPDIDRVWNLVAQGIIRNSSVGYTVQEYEKYEENGNFIYRAVKWTPLELSAVTVPADAGATTRASEAQMGDCFITTRSTIKEKPMKKRSKRENEDDIKDFDDELEEDGARSEDGQDTEGDTPDDNEENRNNDETDEDRGDDEEDKDCRSSKRKSKSVISRRGFIYDLCEASGLSIKEARQFNQSKLSLGEVRAKILSKRSSGVESISNTRSTSVQTTKTLAQRAAEIYKKKG